MCPCSDGLSGGLPEKAWLVALASLPHVGPAALGAMVASAPPVQAWRRVVEGALPDVIPINRRQAIIDAARRVDVGTHWSRYTDAQISVLTSADDQWPSRLTDDPEAPVLLFVRGTPAEPAVTVAIVGTRACSPYGRDVAVELGRAAAEAGVAVISGLAMGIDAAAHRGAVSVSGASPIAVLGAGFDRPTPASNRALYQSVIAHGVVYTETPIGAGGARWRFPARNRIIAGLADAVVVVESDDKGGSFYTVDEALRRDRPVLAVPGSIRARTSRGTNSLLVEGASPCRGIDDVFAAIGLSTEHVRTHRTASVSDEAAALLAWGPHDQIAIDALVAQSQLSAGRCLRLLDELRRAGAVSIDGVAVCRLTTADSHPQ